MYKFRDAYPWSGDYSWSVRDVGSERDAPLADLSPWLDVWRQGAETARRRTAEVRADIAYGTGESERLDLYLPNFRPRKRPFAAFVHGSEWRWAVRADSGFPAKAFHRLGTAFVVIGYATVPSIDLAGQADQVRRAWRFLVDNAASFGLDPARGHLVGHSSGAHLAALTAFDPDGPPPASAVLLSGVYDLEPIRLSERNADLGLDAETAKRLSPIRCISSAVPATLVAWGARESEASRRQSQRFARACKRRGLRAIQGELPGRGHYDTSLELGNPHSQVFTTLRG